MKKALRSVVKTAFAVIMIVAQLVVMLKCIGECAEKHFYSQGVA